MLAKALSSTPAEAPVVGQLVVVGSPERLDRLGHLAVGERQPGGAQPVEQGGAHDGVGEGEAPGVDLLEQGDVEPPPRSRPGRRSGDRSTVVASSSRSKDRPITAAVDSRSAASSAGRRPRRWPTTSRTESGTGSAVARRPAPAAGPARRSRPGGGGARRRRRGCRRSRRRPGGRRPPRCRPGRRGRGRRPSATTSATSQRGRGRSWSPSRPGVELGEQLLQRVVRPDVLGAVAAQQQDAGVGRAVRTRWRSSWTVGGVAHCRSSRASTSGWSVGQPVDQGRPRTGRARSGRRAWRRRTARPGGRGRAARAARRPSPTAAAELLVARPRPRRRPWRRAGTARPGRCRRCRPARGRRRRGPARRPGRSAGTCRCPAARRRGRRRPTPTRASSQPSRATPSVVGPADEREPAVHGQGAGEGAGGDGRRGVDRPGP